MADNIGDNTLDQTFTVACLREGEGHLRQRQSPLADGLGAYTYPAATAPKPHAPLTAGAKTFGYDANGNMIADGTRALGYDDETVP